MTRLILFLVGLAFAGSFVLVGCEPSGDKPADKPKADAPKSPPPPPPPGGETPKPPEKTSAVTPGLPAPVVAVISATQCAMAGCTKTGNPTKTLAKDGKTLMFCCDDCLAGYKKANNIQ